MGFGKTHATLALICAAVEAGAVRPSLVGTPTSVVDPWIEEGACVRALVHVLILDCHHCLEKTRHQYE